MQAPHGTSARVWIHMLSCFALCTTVTSGAPLAEGVLALYSRLISATERRADTLSFRMNSRKLAIHSADHFERMSRALLGNTNVEVRCVQESARALSDPA